MHFATVYLRNQRLVDLVSDVIYIKCCRFCADLPVLLINLKFVFTNSLPN